LSFTPSQPRLMLEYDASLTGIGILVNILEIDGSEHPWKALLCKLPYNPQGNSSFQNSVEFIAIVLGFAGIAKSGVSGASIAIRGDNRSSLAWALKESFRSPRVRNAATVYTFIGIQFNIHTSDAVHIAGTSNVTTDGWSRGYTNPSDLGFRDQDMLFADNDPVLDKLLRLMDPTHTALEFASSAIPFLRAAGVAVASIAH